MMHQDSLEPAAIRFLLERLQESARRSGYFLPAFFMHLAISTRTLESDLQYYLKVLLVEPNGPCFIY